MPTTGQGANEVGERAIFPYYLVDAVVHAPFGSHPGEMAYVYGLDEEEIKAWVEASKTAEDAQAYLEKFVFDIKNHDEYMKLIGDERLKQCVELRERRQA